jgi:hypothetical protein
VHGATDPNPDHRADPPSKNLVDPVHVGDVHATILKALDLPWQHAPITPIGRPMAYAEGEPIEAILRG